MTETPDPQNPFLNSHDVSMRLFDLYLDRKYYTVERLATVLNDGSSRIVGADVDERSRAAGRLYREKDVVTFAAAFVLKDLHRWKADALRELFRADPDVAPWVLEKALGSGTVKPGFRISMHSDRSSVERFDPRPDQESQQKATSTRAEGLSLCYLLNAIVSGFRRKRG